MKNPGFLKDACSAFGGHIIVGLDAKDGKVATDGWSKLTGHEVVDLARKFQDYGVEGVIYTDMLAWGITQTPGLEADLISQHPIGRLGQLEEVTNAAMWLCSDEAGFVTGTTLTVDGGHLAR